MSRKVYVETPYSGDIAENVNYAILCMRDCLQRGEAPFLSHLLYTQAPNGRGFVADDSEHVTSVGRDAAIAAAQEWRKVADATVLYTDRGISGGMQAGAEHAQAIGQSVEYRILPGWAQKSGDRTNFELANIIVSASTDSEARAVASERKTRTLVLLAPTPKSEFVDDEARQRYAHLRALLRIAGDYDDAHSLQPPKQDLRNVIIHLLNATTQYGFHDIGRFVPDAIVWLSSISFLRALAYLMSAHQLQVLWDALCMCGNDVCNVNLRSKEFLSNLEHATDDRVCLTPTAKPRDFFAIQKYKRTFFIPMKGLVGE